MSTLLRKRRFIWTIALCLFALLSAGGYFSGRRYVDAARWVTHTFEVTAAIDGAVSLVQDVESGQRGFLLTGDAAFLEPYERARSDWPHRLVTLRDLSVDNPSQRERCARLERWVTEKLSFSAETIERKRVGGDFIGMVLTGRGKVLMEEIRQVASAMRAEEKSLLVERTEHAAGAQRRTIAYSMIGVALMLGLVLFSLSTVQGDLRELLLLSEELSVAEKKFRDLAENASDLILLVDATNRVTYVSPSVTHLLGYTPEEFVELGPEAVLPEPDWSEAQAWVSGLIEQKLRTGIKSLRYRRKDGRYRWFEVSASILKEGNEAQPTILLSARDVHEQRLAHEALAERADVLEALSTTDALTGLLNRRGFMEQALEILENTRAAHGALGLVFVDLDGLKPINDQLGHDAGDRALGEAARLLRQTCRGGDLVARLGGDEFAVLARDLTPEGYGRFRERVQRALERANANEERTFRLAFSLGAAFFEPLSGESLESLLKRADAIMYEEKKARKGART